MAGKKASTKKSRAAGAKSAVPPQSEEPKGNFLVVRVPRALRRNQSMTVLEFAETEDKARKYVEKLTDSSPAFLAILEKKALLERRPQMVVHEVKGNA